jgi:DNA repair protein RecO (recombination protein O)
LVADLVLKTTEKHDPHPYVFEMMDKALDCLEGGIPPEGLAVSFFMKYLEHLGFRPRLDGCACGASVPGKQSLEFNVPLGGLCCERCAREAHGTLSSNGFRTHFCLDRDSLAILKRLRLARFESLGETSRQTERLRELTGLLGAYVEYHFETRLKSLGFWRDLHGMKEKPSE